jgi:hypothetical protein
MNQLEKVAARIPVKQAADNFWEPLTRVRSEFDHLLDDFWTRPIGLSLTRRIQALSGPALELKDKETEYELVAEIPGMKVEDVELKVSDGLLRLTGEKKEKMASCFPNADTAVSKEQSNCHRALITKKLRPRRAMGFCRSIFQKVLRRLNASARSQSPDSFRHSHMCRICRRQVYSHPSPVVELPPNEERTRCAEPSPIYLPIDGGNCIIASCGMCAR